jgi:hypothetical protein
MARIVPSDLSRLALSGAHQPELATLAVLKDALPDHYTVFHGVHWSRQYQGTTVYGEVDFVVLNHAGRVLCIEQKNGPLLERDGALIKVYGEQEKDVGDQILRAVGNIKAKFQYQCGKLDRLAIDYLIYCPDHAIAQLQSVALDRERIVDAPLREKLADTIRTILPPGPDEPSWYAGQVAAFFHQTFELVPDVHAHVDAQEANFIRLSGGLVEIIDNIEMTPLRLRVSATAGSGKTQVVRHHFSRLAKAGRRPLLLCFNRPLAERLKHLVEPAGLVETWYGFCDRFLQAHGIKLDFASMRANPSFWPDAAARVEEIVCNGTLSEDWRFDDLIIDEAQDFEAEWLDIARLFLPDEDRASILWLEDPNQNVRGVEPPFLQDFVGYRAALNFRTPERIARFIQQVLPEFPFVCANDLPGLGVGVTGYDSPEEQPKRVGKLIARLLKERFQHRQIAILSCRGLGSTAFRGRERAGNYTLSRFTETYDLFGNQVWGKGQILFDTVRRFKGQQEAAVILTDVDPGVSHSLEDDLRVLFCGMTRATVRLEIVCHAGNPWAAERLLR